MFSVLVSKFFRGEWRNVTAMATIEATLDTPPSCSIDALTLAKANPSERLLLTASAGPAELDFDLEWGLVAGDLVTGALADSATTSLTDSVEAYATDVNYLVLPAGTLTAGATYQFQLTATYSDPGTGDLPVGYSVLTVVVNAPPSSGALAIQPTVGVVLETGYDYAASGWVDDIADLPLLYSFFYSIYGAATEYQLVANTPTTSYDGALLPRGGGNASLITGIAYIADQLGASSRATDVVVCGPMVVSVTDLANLTARLLSASFESGNVEGVFNAMVASSSVLNAPNCSLDGLLTCAALNRDTCAVENTCADCVEGYVGLAGPSNEPCTFEAASCSNGAFDAESESDVDCGGSCAPCEATGANCTLGADCAYNWCRSGVCAVPVKPCVNNCTGHGRCEYWDTTAAQLQASECTADLWSCTATCACDAGWCVVFLIARFCVQARRCERCALGVQSVTRCARIQSNSIFGDAGTAVRARSTRLRGRTSSRCAT